MYDINKFPQILYHLKNISNIFADKGSHINMFCPFCNDATRKPNPSHGHCYISKELPVYYCHRCGEAGTIMKLLFYTEFDDIDTINQLKGFIKFNFVKDYVYQKVEKKVDYRDLIKFINYKINNINHDHLSKFEDYVNYRLGHINYGKFLLYPDFIKPFEKTDYQLLSACFNNSLNQFIEGRFINPIQKMRYNKNKQNYQYFFQNWDFERINEIVITEGAFDLLNIYLYENKFNKDTFYLSMSGKRYITVLESLIYQELLLKSCRIHIIFDNDNKYMNSTINKCKNLVNTINTDIDIFGWKPYNLFKDVGQYPILTKI